MYIERTLIAFRGTNEERSVREDEIPSLSPVVVLLGEPGIGKTELTLQLQNSLGATRFAAGTFWRTRNPSLGSGPLIIDGLDEISASTSEPPLDAVLRLLSALNFPNVIISCRAADWIGSVNRHKILQDYGVIPVPVHILPFDSDQAKAFIAAYDARIDSNALLAAIEHQGLNDLSGNPLTLKLLAEVWLQDAGLPKTKTDLLERASRLLVNEENDAHGDAPHAQASLDHLLEIAGAIFAHLLLSGMVGIALRRRHNAVEGFVPLSEFNGLSVGDAEATIKTRLFKSETLDQLTPVHRVVAEFLAGKWLSQKLDAKLSERRLFRMIEFNGGVPSALRGLHAWLGYFSPRVAKRCIDTDPYGFLRYGDTAKLSISNARHLLAALTRLAAEDPYFRSEDWGVRAVAGLARPELQSEILELITSEARHVQLSALVISSLAGSLLTDTLVPELLKIVRDTSAPYVERITAIEVLAKSDVAMDWSLVVKDVLSQKRHESSRLAAESIAIVGPTKFPPEITGEALVALNGINESSRREARVFGSDYLLISRTPPTLAQQILDVIAQKIDATERKRHWHPGRSMDYAITRKGD